MQRLHAYFSGRVQGVGFRYTVKALAHGFDLTGIVRNLADGRVEVVVEGEKAELEAFEAAIEESELGIFIRNTELGWSQALREFRGFEIVR
jgi:acylphosphatase